MRRSSLLPVLAAGTLAAALATPALARAQSFVSSLATQGYGGCSAAGCASALFTTGTPSGRYTPPGQPTVGGDWLGFVVRYTFTFAPGAGIAPEARYTLLPSAGTASVDFDARQFGDFVGSTAAACNDLYVRYATAELTCTTSTFTDVAGFVSPNFVLRAISVPLLVGTPGAFVNRPGTAATITLTATPEPTTFVLGAAGVLLLGAVAHRRSA